MRGGGHCRLSEASPLSMLDVGFLSVSSYGRRMATPTSRRCPLRRYITCYLGVRWSWFDWRARANYAGGSLHMALGGPDWNASIWGIIHLVGVDKGFWVGNIVRRVRKILLTAFAAVSWWWPFLNCRIVGPLCKFIDAESSLSSKLVLVVAMPYHHWLRLKTICFAF